MGTPFLSVRYVPGEKQGPALGFSLSRPRAVRGPAGVDAPLPEEGTDFANDEAAARFYCSRVLARDERPVVRGLVAPDRPEAVPDLAFRRIAEQTATRTQLVHFEQTQRAVPVFGTKIVVELDAKKQLVSLDAELADVPRVSPLATIPPQEA